MASPLSNLVDGTVFGAAQVNPIIGRANQYITCTSTTRPASPSAGWSIRETDTGRFLWYDGTNWRGIQSYRFGAAASAITTSAGTESSTFCQLVVPDQGCAGTLLLWGNFYFQYTVSSDFYQVMLKTSGGTFFAAARSSGGLSIPVIGSVVMAAGASLTVNATMQRLTGTGTLTSIVDGTLDAMTALFVPT